MAFGFPAYHTEQVTIDNEKDAYAVVRNSLESLRWPVKSEYNGSLFAARQANLLSWGEDIQIRFLENNQVEITSKCKLFTQCIDWGRNKSNVLELLSEIQRQSQ